MTEMFSDGTTTETEYVLYSHMCVDMQLLMHVVCML